tara:strand:+ start:55711 stop:55866 length:156 start_codon:yes stop_codon:yes gene_type:complete
MEQETITIPINVYQKLMKDQCLLNCLHIAGVDNWEGYYEAIEIFNEEEEDA